jgi:hypothetical protein
LTSTVTHYASGICQVAVAEIAKDLWRDLLAVQGEGAADLGDEGGRRRRVAGRRGQRDKRRADHPQREGGVWAGQRSQVHGAFPLKGWRIRSVRMTASLLI